MGKGEGREEGEERREREGSEMGRRVTKQIFYSFTLLMELMGMAGLIP